MKKIGFGTRPSEIKRRSKKVDFEETHKGEPSDQLKTHSRTSTMRTGQQGAGGFWKIAFVVVISVAAGLLLSTVVSFDTELKHIRCISGGRELTIYNGEEFQFSFRDGLTIEEATFKASVYTPRQHIADVLAVALKNLGLVDRRVLTKGIKRSRLVPDEDWDMGDTAIIETFDYDSVENAVKSIFQKIGRYEQETGHADIDPTIFVPSGLSPAQ